MDQPETPSNVIWARPTTALAGPGYGVLRPSSTPTFEPRPWPPTATDQDERWGYNYWQREAGPGMLVPVMQLRDGLPAIGATWLDGLTAAFCTARMIQHDAIHPKERGYKHLAYLVRSTADTYDFQTLMEAGQRKPNSA